MAPSAISSRRRPSTGSNGVLEDLLSGPIKDIKKKSSGSSGDRDRDREMTKHRTRSSSRDGLRGSGGGGSGSGGGGRSRSRSASRSRRGRSTTDIKRRGRRETKEEEEEKDNNDLDEEEDQHQRRRTHRSKSKDRSPKSMSHRDVRNSQRTIRVVESDNMSNVSPLSNRSMFTASLSYGTTTNPSEDLSPKTQVSEKKKPKSIRPRSQSPMKRFKNMLFGGSGVATSTSHPKKKVERMPEGSEFEADLIDGDNDLYNYDDNDNGQDHYSQDMTSTEQALLEAQEFARQFADDSESGGADDPIPLLHCGTIPATHASALDYYNQRSNHGGDREIPVRSVHSSSSAVSRDNNFDWNSERRSLDSAHRRPSEESLGARSYDGGVRRSFHSSGNNSVESIPRERVYREFVSDRSLDSHNSFSEETEHIEYQVQEPQNLSTNEIALTNSNEEVGSYASSRSSADTEQHIGEVSHHSHTVAGSAGGSAMDTPPIQRLRDAGNDVVDLLNCMRNYPDSPDVQAIGLQTISDLDLSEEDSAMLANIGIIQVVAGAMVRFQDDLDMQVYGCRTIWNISGTPENQRILVEGGALNVLQRTMAHFIGDVELQEQALAVVANIAAVEDNLGPLLEAGAVGRLVEAMNRHAGNGDVQVKGCLAMANLASHSSAPKQQLIEAGGGSAIVISMVMHPTNPELQEKALRALRNLSANCDHNRVELTNIGGIDAIISAMQVHRDCAGVQEVGAWTLSNLAGNADSRVLIGDCGGIDVVVRAMWVHADKVSVQEWCARALYALAMDPHNAKMVLDVGGISAIVNAMQAHVDSAAVQETGCAVLCGLAYDQQSKMRIVDEEALDAVVLAMVLHGDDAAVNERACRLLLQLSIAENFKAMQASNVGELVRSAAHKFPESCGEPAEELIHVIEGFISEYL